MKTIIAGSRSIKDCFVVDLAIREATEKLNFTITAIISGGADGVDKNGEQWARENKIPLYRYKANWKKYGNRAGIVRNIDMLNEADALIAIWDGDSRGTAHMIDIARAANLKYIYVYRVEVPGVSPPF